jgi:hypothetical protein
MCFFNPRGVNMFRSQQGHSLAQSIMFPLFCTLWSLESQSLSLCDTRPRNFVRRKRYHGGIIEYGVDFSIRTLTPLGPCYGDSGSIPTY